MIEQIKNALSHIDSDDRITWVRMGGAIKSELGEKGFSIWNEWSKKSSKYNEKSALSQWKHLEAGRVNIGSLFYEAKQNGYIYNKSDFKTLSSDEIKAIEKRANEERELAKQNRIQEINEAKINAKKRWKNGKPLEIKNNQYLQKKGLTESVFLKDILKQDDKNNLLIPIYSQGDLVGTQRITYTSDKFLEKGMQSEGFYLLIGKWENVKKNGLNLVEGLATGASIYEATNTPTMVSFSGYNMKVLAQKLKETTNIKVNIITDIDKFGIKNAESCKEILGDNAVILKPIFSEEDIINFTKFNGKAPSDFNDLHLLKGIDYIKNQLLTTNLEKEIIMFDDEKINWNDKQTVLNAIQKEGEGRALEFASDSLKNDREVVLSAISNDGESIIHASKDLQNDREFVKQAIIENSDVFEFTPQFHKDVELINIAKNSHSPIEDFINKFDFINEDKITLDGIELTRIKALRDIPEHGIKGGDLGGYLESESNLSQNGYSWVNDNSKVYGNAKIIDNGYIANEAIVKDNSIVKDNAKVLDNAVISNGSNIENSSKVYGNSYVSLSTIKNNSEVSGSVYIEQSTISDNVKLQGNLVIKYKEVNANTAEDFNKKNLFSETLNKINKEKNDKVISNDRGIKL